ncbi:MAG: acylphosphatase [Bacteroidales bacterium]|jgi:acylphosphatase
MENLARAEIAVRGRVQGVGYRYATLKMARSLGLNGYVKNKPDGSVFIEAQGSLDHVRMLVEWCKSGPDHAVVESVDFAILPLRELDKFQIR